MKMNFLFHRCNMLIYIAVVILGSFLLFWLDKHLKSIIYQKAGHN